MSPPNTYWERWDVPANKSLLRFITQNGPRLSARWPDQSSAISAILRKHSQAWAKDMRDADRDGQTPPDKGEVWWAQNMARAEAEMADKLGPGVTRA